MAAGKKLGPPMQGVKEALTELMNQGHQIIVHSALANNKPGREAVAKWLAYYEIPYTDIWIGPGKPVAGLYVDDKGYQFTNWEQAISDIVSLDGPDSRSVKRTSLGSW